MIKISRASKQAALLITEAEKYIGYTAPFQQADMFSQTVGQPGIPWAGAFLDVVIKRAGLVCASHVLTASILARYMSENRIYKNPRPGDIVFFEPSSDSSTIPFGQPHVGLVTDVEHFTKHGMFQCIEGQTDSGLPKGNSSKNGVYRRTRYVYEVLAFARPKLSAAGSSPELSTKEQKLPVVHSSIIRPGLKHPSVVIIQLALSAVVGLRGAPRGEFDHKTRSAFANFERSLGFQGERAAGIPNPGTLRKLAETSKLFTSVD
jgi:hypothetical protein